MLAGPEQVLPRSIKSIAIAARRRRRPVADVECKRPGRKDLCRTPAEVAVAATWTEVRHQSSTRGWDAAECSFTPHWAVLGSDKQRDQRPPENFVLAGPQGAGKSALILPRRFPVSEFVYADVIQPSLGPETSPAPPAAS